MIAQALAGSSGGVSAVVDLGIVALAVGMALMLYQMVKGPHLADRAIAGDALALQVVGLVVLLAVDQRRSVSLDVALMVAIVGFAVTVAFAQYLVGLKADQESPEDGAGS
ncbi:MAG: monovalent cation/H+ antiporter complex subunit F [Actinomycetota bacterium]|nr:monovalent cation/H+ antiporter complex subunit F [Actinomycetota bacterium]